MIDVEISIVTDNNRDILRRCLATLDGSARAATVAVTVVDNVCTDGTSAVLAVEYPCVTVLENTRRLGFGENHNQVLARSSARYSLVLNDDTELAPLAVDALVAFMDRNPSVGAAVPAVRDALGRDCATRLQYPTWRSTLRFDFKGVGEGPDPGGWLSGCCLMLRRDALADAGLFDDRFFLFYEDIDLSARIVGAGWNLAACPQAVVVHLGHASVLRPDLTVFSTTQGLHSRYLYFAKHHGPRRAALLATSGRALLAVRAARSAWRGSRSGDRALVDAARLHLVAARYDPRRPPVLPPRPAAPPPAEAHPATGAVTDQRATTGVTRARQGDY